MRVLSEQPNKKSYQDGNLRLKVFGASFQKSDILNEALNQARVEETGLQIPKLLEVKQIDGQWTIVTEFIEGETLESLMAAHPEKMTEYLEQFVALQSEILSKRAPLLNRLKDKMNRKIRESGLDATTRYELHMRLNGMREHEKICHGDFNPSNVIVTPDGDWYVIDWSQCRCSENISAVLPEWQGRRCRTVLADFLRKERHCKAVCAFLDADCGSFPAWKGQGRRTGISAALGERGTV